MKKYLIAVTALIIICALTVGLAACGSGGETLEETDIKPGAAFVEAIEKVANASNIDVGEDMNLKFSGYIYFKKSRRRIGIDADVNCVSGNVRDMSIVSEVSDGGSYGVYLDGKDCYIDFGEVGYRFNDVIAGVGKDRSAVADGRISTTESAFLELVGNMVFSEVLRKGDGYVFKFNLGEVFDEYLDGMLALGGIDSDQVLAFLGYDDESAFISDMKNVKGDISFNFRGDRFWGANADFKNDAGAEIGVTGFSIDGKVENVDYAELIPEKDYVLTKALNFKMKGDLTLEGEGAAVAKYNWRLLADVDPFNPKENDKFHFVLSNKLDENSDEYNAEKVGAVDGVVLEIAYSPEEFGSDNILFAVNLKSIIDKKILENMGVSAAVGQILPDYYGGFIDINAINRLGDSGKVRGKSSEMNTLGGILSKIKFTGDGLRIDRGLLDLIAGGGIISELLDTESTSTEAIELKVDALIYGGNNDGYKMSEHFFNTADENGGKKSFGAVYKPALKAEPINNGGFAEMTTAYGKKLGDGINKISAEELETLIGGTVKYSYTAFDGSIRTARAPVTILGVSGVDSTLKGVEQEIMVLTSMPEGDNFLSSLKLLGINVDLPLNVFKTKIILSEEKSAEFIDNSGKSEYRTGEELLLSKDDITLNIEYADGGSYTCNALEFYHDAPLLNGKLSEAGRYRIVYKVGGREYTKDIEVAAPDLIEAVIDNNIGTEGENVPESFGKLILRYGDDVIEEEIRENMIIFPKGIVKEGKFDMSGDFFVRVKGFGYNKVMRVNVNPK